MKYNFRKDLEAIINAHGIEEKSNTPDFILAQFLIVSLMNLEEIIKERDKWYDHEEVIENLEKNNSVLKQELEEIYKLTLLNEDIKKEQLSTRIKQLLKTM